jgi:hypothetical protein
MSTRSADHGAPNPLLILSLAAIVLAAPVLAASQCPENVVKCYGTTCCDGIVEFYVSETSRDPVCGVSSNGSSASYDLVNGTLSAVVNVDDVYRHRSEVVAADQFELHNAASAVLKIRLHLSFYWMADPSGRMAWADGAAQLTVGAQSAYAESLGPGIDPYIELDVEAYEGAPFTIVYETTAVASGYYPSGAMTCRLEFVDLPPGAEVTSCNGYGSSGVAVEETTWSSIKALYR